MLSSLLQTLLDVLSMWYEILHVHILFFDHIYTLLIKYYIRSLLILCLVRPHRNHS